MRSLTPLAAGASVTPDQVLFESRGVVLVLGDDASAGDVLPALAPQHRAVLFAPGAQARDFGRRVTSVGARVTGVRGRLGAFRAEIRGAAGVMDIGAASPNPDRRFDMVLDLMERPLIGAALKPVGYFAPGADASARSAAIESMRALVGRFTRPRYLEYQPEFCTHGASGLRGCSRCEDVCAAQAIASAGSTIRVDPHLCQGCAACTLACPTGALHFKSPSPEESSQRLRSALQGRDPRGAIIVVHAGALGEQALSCLADHDAIVCAVDPLASFGEELWLKTLASGVRALALVDGPAATDQARAVMKSRVADVRSMLSTGKLKERLLYVDEAELVQWLQSRTRHSPTAAAIAVPASGSTAAAVPLAATSKRRTSLEALRALNVAGSSAPLVELPLGAPFGEVRLNRGRCTLCVACAQLCPTGALEAKDGRTRELLFRESACVQCGLCTRACPEQAIALHARFAPSALGQAAARVLHQDEQVACKACRKPFISRRLLAWSLERRQGHLPLAHGAREALMRCPACRQQDSLELS